MSISVSGKGRKIILLSAAVAADTVTAVLLTFAVDSADYTNSGADMARLGVMTFLLLTVIPFKAILDYRLRKIKKPPEKAGESELLQKLETQLETAPLELAARRAEYMKIVTELKKTALKKSIKDSLINILPGFLLILTAFIGGLLAYKDIVTVGGAAGAAYFVYGVTRDLKAALPIPAIRQPY